MRYRIAACVLFAGLLPGFLAIEGYWKGRIPAAWQGKQLLEPLESPEAALGRRDVESEMAPAKRREIFENLARMPLYFIENRGQLDRRVAYYVPGHRWSLYFTPGGVTYAITADQASPDSGRSGRPWQAPVAFRRAHEAELQARRWALKLDFLGANPAARPVGVEPAPAVVSYFKGSPEQWKTGLPSYAKVLYRELWPGIDLVYAGTGGQLKYTFLVQPGADPSRIRLAWRGAEAVSLNAAGQLEVSTPLGRFREEKPYVFQEVDGARVEVPAAYRLEGRNGFRFELGAYDAAKPLVLDPVVLVYAGFLGGSGSDSAFGIAVDGSGQAYVAGETASPDFPAAVGPDTTFNGVHDAFVAKIKADGTGLVYAGLLGGSGSDSAFGIAVDGSGQAYVAGRTDSSDFPALVGPDTTYNGGFDAFVAKIKADGTGLVYSGYLGGSGSDSASGIAVDGIGQAYVAGRTASTDFPVVGGPDTTYNGGFDDAFVAKIKADGTGLVYAGFLGGSGTEIASGIAVDGIGQAYVAGLTASPNFPAVVGPDTTYNGSADAFVAKIKADGTGLVYAGFLGGSGTDLPSRIAVDGIGQAYVAGWTDSSDFPAAGGPDTTYNGGFADAFVAKIKADGTGLVYSGFLGGSGADLPFGIAVDGSGQAYVAGWTASPNFPAAGGPDTTYNGGDADAFVAKIKADGTGLVYSGFLGGSGNDHAYGIAVDGSGQAYVAGWTSSPDFPAAGGPDTTYNGGFADAFVAKISSSLRVKVDLKPQSNPNCVNPRSRGTVSVAIFGSSTFHAAAIRPSTVSFGGAPALRCNLEDAFQEGPTGFFTQDGIPDLVCHFSVEAVSWPAAGTNCGPVGLAGTLIDDTPIEGSDIACRAGETTCAAGAPIPVP